MEKFYDKAIESHLYKKYGKRIIFLLRYIITMHIREPIHKIQYKKKFLAFQLILIALFVIIITVIFQKDFNQKNIQMSEEKQLIPRSVIFGNPDKIGVKVSPDGKHITYIAPHNGVLNIFLAKNGNINEAKVITNDTHRGIREYFWTYDNNIIYLQDDKGNENQHLYQVDIKSGNIEDLTQLDGVKASVAAVSQKFPNHILVLLNDRRKDLFDLHLINLTNGTRSLVYENDTYMNIDIDEDFQLRFGAISMPNGGVKIHMFEKQENGISKHMDRQVIKLTNDDLKPQELMDVSPDDVYTTNIVGFIKNDDGILNYQQVYMLDSRGRDKAKLIKFNVKTKQQEGETIFESDKADVHAIIQNPTSKAIEAVSVNYLKEEWTFMNDRVKNVFKALLEKFNSKAEVQITSRSLDDDVWIVAITSDIAPPQYYKVNPNSKNITFLFSGDSKLEKQELVPMHPVIIKAEDGLELVSYLTAPKNVKIEKENDYTIKANKAVPLIMYVHGGPTARDEWGLDKVHQWLANRGYAVLSVNYRGSTGFGKKFINKGNGEWSKKMHTDILDAAEWAVKNGITTQDNIGIMGGSYGGYEALVGLTFSPDFFRCAVDIVGPSNLVTLLESIPEYWKPYIENLNRKTGGNINTEEGKEELLARSPITHVTKIKKPLLIGQGANDPRVKQTESDQIVSAMEKNNIPVIYALYPDEGHGFARPENRMSFFALTEEFLHKHMKGGKLEELTENDLQNSSLEILKGAEQTSISSIE